jgi:predicted permease
VQAAAELAAIGAALEREQGKPRLGPPLHAIPSSRAGGNRTLVLGLAGLLLAIGLTVLAVACANVAAILLTRATARCTELALRIALGASRARLVRQLLTETIILAGLGGVVGLVLARAMISFTPLLPALPFPIDVPLQLDWRVVTFTTLLTFTAALSAGVAPAFTGSKANPAAALKDRQASDSGSRLRRLFVGGQVALSVLLIVTAGLFVRALRYAGAAEPGFDARGVEIAALDLSMAGVNEGARSSFWRTLRQSVRRLPDVESASLARVPPGGFEGIGLGTLSMPGAITPERFSPAWNIVDPGYFATLRIPLIAGRDFSDGDVQGSPPVAIVGEALARRLWPTATGIGEHLAVSIFTRGKLEERSLLVVGVVRDIKSSSLIDGLAESYVYLPLQQSDETTLTTRMSIVARSRRGQRIDAELAAAVRQLNSGLLVARSETMEQAIALGLAPQRLLATAAGSLGLIGLLLAAIGINGVTAFAVVRRRHEIGIRLALGAQRRAIVGEIVRQGMKLIVVGAVAGLLLAAGASQALSIFLYGLPPIHVPTFVGTAILFVLVGLTACWVPARRAVSADPYQTLREE